MDHLQFRQNLKNSCPGTTRLVPYSVLTFYFGRNAHRTEHRNFMKWAPHRVPPRTHRCGAGAMRVETLVPSHPRTSRSFDMLTRGEVTGWEGCGKFSLLVLFYLSPRLLFFSFIFLKMGGGKKIKKNMLKSAKVRPKLIVVVVEGTSAVSHLPIIFLTLIFLTSTFWWSFCEL